MSDRIPAALLLHQAIRRGSASPDVEERGRARRGRLRRLRRGLHPVRPDRPRRRPFDRHAQQAREYDLIGVTVRRFDGGRHVESPSWWSRATSSGSSTPPGRAAAPSVDVGPRSGTSRSRWVRTGPRLLHALPGTDPSRRSAGARRWSADRRPHRVHDRRGSRGARRHRHRQRPQRMSRAMSPTGWEFVRRKLPVRTKRMVSKRT